MAIYTRKTFVAISDLLSEFNGDMDEIVFEDLVEAFGDMFAADNKNFDFERFREACLALEEVPNE
jgi:hypothetical protein